MSDKPASLTPAPQGYADWLADLKRRIHTAQQRAALAVNRELVRLYWQIGRDILTRQGEQGWGAKVVDRLAHDLHIAFPDMKGFSPRNLKYMRAFAEAWPDESFVQEVLAQLPCCCAKATPSRWAWPSTSWSNSCLSSYRPACLALSRSSGNWVIL